MRITGRTRIMFILADAVDHIVGSDVLNRAFERDGLDVAVSPLSVTPEDLEAMVGMIRRIGNVVGFGVTIPHKPTIAPFLDAVTPEAHAVGAVNFVKREPDGRLTGHNIDGEGFVTGLRNHGIDPKGLHILQIGAGGVGKAIAHALAADGAGRIDLVNRNPSRSSELAGALRVRFPDIDIRTASDVGEFGDIRPDLIVNATSLGMHEGDELPVPDGFLSKEAIVAEVIMRPAMTPMLERASANGCRIVPGTAMMEPQPALVAEFLGLA